jgi:hypothetical protein
MICRTKIITIFYNYLSHGNNGLELFSDVSKLK